MRAGLTETNRLDDGTNDRQTPTQILKGSAEHIWETYGISSSYDLR